MKIVIQSAVALLLGGAALVGCAMEPETGSESSATPLDISTALTPQPVHLRFAHGSPTSSAFDVYLGASTTPLFTAAAFGTATAYADVPADGLQLVLRTAGAAATDAPVYTSAVFAAQPGDTITSIAGGILGTTIASLQFRVLPYTEAFDRPERGHAQVRFVHDSHGVGATGFDVGADGTIEAPDLAAFTGSDAAGVPVPRADRGVQLAIDTGVPATQLTSFTLPAEVLAQRGGIFIALVGIPSFVPSDDRGLAVLAIGRRTTALIRQNPSVFVLPAIPDSAGVDLFAIGRDVPVVQFGANVGFGVLAPVLQVPPTERGVRVVIANAGGKPLAIEPTGPLVAGERYLAIASGFADGRSRVQLTIEREGFDRTFTADARLRVVAASPDAPAVDFGQIPPGTTTFTGIAGLEAVAYRQASAEAGAAVSTSAPLNPAVRATGTTSALRFRFGALTLVDRAFGVFAGAFAPAASDVGSRFIMISTPATGKWTATTLSPL